jgi:hypothetical protein
VAVPAGDPLLEAPGIRTAAQHVEIVVGLDQQDVQILEAAPGETRPAAEVGRQADPPAQGILDHQADRLARVVRQDERLDQEPCHLARLPRS